MNRCFALLLTLFFSASLSAQVETQVPPVEATAKPVTVERITIHGPSLEGNLEGNAVDREALVFLPPGYADNPNKRYPVIYALHGYSIGAQQWSQEIHVPQTIEGAFARGARDMIVVLPDSKTRHNGSMYSSSVTTGDFEHYVARDVVSYMDRHYRTIPARESRGLVGHSMGGYGAVRIGMKHDDVFSSVYIMSPGLLSARGAGEPGELEKIAAAMTSPAESEGQPFFVRAQLAVAAAWSPNPQNPPLYLDLPYKDGVLQEDVVAKWAANAPLAFLDQYVSNLKRYRAIALDIGDADGGLAGAEQLHELMVANGIVHDWDVYEGTHTSHVAIRFQNHVMPFFSSHLATE